jgi:RNA polymerase sigma factor (sigma-70 family)
MMTGMEALEKYYYTKEEKYFEYGIEDTMDIIMNKLKQYNIYTRVEEFVQEVKLKVWKAFTFNYDPSRSGVYTFFVNVCDNAIVQYLKRINRFKRVALLEAVSLNETIDDETETEFIELLQEDEDLEYKVVNSIEYERLKKVFVSMLTPMEKNIFEILIEDHNSQADYKLIMEETGYRAKQIDNALWRIRKKAENATFLKD